MPLTRQWLRLSLLWMLACAVGYVVREFLVFAVGVWSPDGHLAVSPSVFNLVVSIHFTVIGVVWCTLAWMPSWLPTRNSPEEPTSFRSNNGES